MKTVPVDAKKLNDVVDKQVVKKTKFKTLKTKSNKMDKRILDATILIYINQYKTDKQILKKKFKMLIQIYLTLLV